MTQVVPAVKPAKYYPEFILAISREHADTLLQEGFDRTFPEDRIPEFQAGLTIRQRQWLDFSENKNRDGVIRTGEESPEVLAEIDSKHHCRIHTTKIGDDADCQVLPYVTVRNHEFLLLPYLRGPGVGEGRLEGKASVSFGGHVDLADVVHTNSVIDLHASIRLNIQRELEEEIIVFKVGSDLPEDTDVPVFTAGDLKFNGLINDHSDQVGRLHLGFSYDFILKPGYSARSREEALRALAWQTGEALFDMPGVEVENWSALYLRG